MGYEVLNIYLSKHVGKDGSCYSGLNRISTVHAVLIVYSFGILDLRLPSRKQVHKYTIVLSRLAGSRQARTLYEKLTSLSTLTTLRTVYRPLVQSGQRKDQTNHFFRYFPFGSLEVAPSAAVAYSVCNYR